MFDATNVTSDTSPFRAVEVGTLHFSFPKAFPLDQDLLALSVRHQYSPLKAQTTPIPWPRRRCPGLTLHPILPVATRKPLPIAGSVHTFCSVPTSKGPRTTFPHAGTSELRSARAISRTPCLPPLSHPCAASYALQATFTLACTTSAVKIHNLCVMYTR